MLVSLFLLRYDFVDVTGLESLIHLRFHRTIEQSIIMDGAGCHTES